MVLADDDPTISNVGAYRGEGVRENLHGPHLRCDDDRAPTFLGLENVRHARDRFSAQLSTDPLGLRGLLGPRLGHQNPSFVLAAERMGRLEGGNPDNEDLVTACTEPVGEDSHHLLGSPEFVDVVCTQNDSSHRFAANTAWTASMRSAVVSTTS